MISVEPFDDRRGEKEGWILRPLLCRFTQFSDRLDGPIELKAFKPEKIRVLWCRTGGNVGLSADLTGCDKQEKN